MQKKKLHFQADPEVLYAIIFILRRVTDIEFLRSSILKF